MADEKRIAELTTKLKFETKLEAENQITTLNKEAEEIQKAYDDAIKAVNEYRKSAPKAYRFRGG